MSSSFGAASRPVSAAAPFGFSAWSDGGRSALRVTLRWVLLRARPGPARWRARRRHRRRRRATMSTRAPVPRRVRPAQCWRSALMAHPLIAGDGLFAVVLAAWWQLRRSAHLLPHLRRGRSSFLVHPGHGFVPGIMAIITLQPLLTIYRLRRTTRQVAVHNGYVSCYVSGYVARSAGGESSCWTQPRPAEAPRSLRERRRRASAWGREL